MSLLDVRGLTVDVEVAGATRPILRDVSFEVAQGEALGVVGESGSGKSMTLKAVLAQLPRNATSSGSVLFEGADVLTLDDKALRPILRDDIAAVFQNPQASINPLARIGDFVCEGLIASGFHSRRDAHERAVTLLTDVGVSDALRRMNQYPHELSGGLLQRVVIAAALINEPRLLLADEPTTALDVTTQEEVMAILNEQRTERGLSLVFVTHDLDLAASVCDRIAVMYAGEVVEQCHAGDLHDRASHPYTRALLAARPALGSNLGRFETVQGRPVAAFEAGAGCAFEPRCARSTEVCGEEKPAIRLVKGGLAACHHADGIEREATMSRKDQVSHG